jgi:hypothetical protein
MGLILSSPKVYKPASEVDLGPGSDELYISPNVKGSSSLFLILILLAFRALAFPVSD